MTETRDTSIVIVSWNVRDYLRGCLSSIRTCPPARSHETIVVDNASSDGSAEMVRAEFPEVQLIASDRNLGYCAANNIGLSRAGGRMLVLLNPDTELKPHAIDTITQFLDDHPDIGIVGPDLPAPPGRYRPNGVRFPSLRRELLETTGLRHYLGAVDVAVHHGRSDFTVPAEVDVVCGACTVFRRDVYERIGGLDEQLFMFFDEADFCLRARRAGWRVWYLPDAKVFHHWERSTSQDPARSLRRLFRAQYLYFRKHHGLAPALLLRFVSLFAIASRVSRIRAVAFRDRLTGAARRTQPADLVRSEREHDGPG